MGCGHEQQSTENGWVEVWGLAGASPRESHSPFRCIGKGQPREMSYLELLNTKSFVEDCESTTKSNDFGLAAGVKARSDGMSAEVVVGVKARADGMSAARWV